MDLSKTENFWLFFENLSVGHVFFDVLSFVVFAFTLYWCRRTRNNLSTEEESLTELDDADTESSQSLLSLSNKRQKDLLDDLSAKLSKDELEEEKRTEKMQLEKIFQLLREQEDKFKVTSMEQLQDQLSLYR